MFNSFIYLRIRNLINYFKLISHYKSFNKKIHRINQLIIIGNGFDLHLHDLDKTSGRLTSRFIDFINDRYSYFEKYIERVFQNNLSRDDEKRVLYLKISNLIFPEDKKHSDIENKNFNKNIEKIIKDNELNKFNFWIIYLLLVKHLSNYSNPCWYNIEEYLTIFLNEDKCSINNINKMNVDNIYKSIKNIIGNNIYDMQHVRSTKEHHKYNNDEYDLYILLLIYFILLDDSYLRNKLSKEYFEKNDKNKILVHIGNACRYISINPNVKLEEYEDYNSDTSIESKIYFYLKSEMSDFDMAFNDYLVDQDSRDSDYYKNSYKFLYNMSEDLINRHWHNRIGGPFFSLLNFNYTNPLKYLSSMKLHFFKSQYICRNIHGLLNSKYLNYIKGKSNRKINKVYKKNRILNTFKHNYMKRNNKFNHTLFHLWCFRHSINTPVIGVDGTKIDVTSPKYVFTKTYGIMRRVKNYNERGLLAPRVKYIKFFGHSLGKADYSYFESIFDKYHIYDNKSIMLVFYYNCYKDSNTGKPISDAKASLNQLHSVSKLLGAYCDRQSYHINENELLSSLLLSGRLIIRNIDSIEKN